MTDLQTKLAAAMAFDQNAAWKQFDVLQSTCDKSASQIGVGMARAEHARRRPIDLALQKVVCAADTFVNPKTLDWRESSDNHDALTEALAELERVIGEMRGI